MTDSLLFIPLLIWFTLNIIVGGKVKVFPKQERQNSPEMSDTEFAAIQKKTAIFKPMALKR